MRSPSGVSATVSNDSSEREREQRRAEIEVVMAGFEQRIKEVSTHRDQLL
jgi:predicted component of type VI protein secretion system